MRQQHWVIHVALLHQSWHLAMLQYSVSHEPNWLDAGGETFECEMKVEGKNSGEWIKCSKDGENKVVLF